MDMQPGDVVKTYADVSDLEHDISFKPSTEIEDGMKKFDWYLSIMKYKMNFTVVLLVYALYIFR